MTIDRNISARHSLYFYLQDVRNTRALTADEVPDRDRLITSHLRYVISLAKDMQGYGLPLEDLIQAGNIGLVLAADRFDPSQGVSFATFAKHWIRGEMYEYILRQWKSLKIATTKQQRKLFFKLFSHAGDTRLVGEDLRQLASDLNLDMTDVQDMLARLNTREIPLYSVDDEQDSEMRLPDNRYDPAVRTEAEDSIAKSRQMLNYGLSMLDARSREILDIRWLGDTPRSLQQTANRCGLSKERVRQLEKQAFARLAADSGLAEFSQTAS